MATAYIRDLHDINNDIVYPRTCADAVILPDQHLTIMEEMKTWGENSTTESYSGNTKTKVYTETGDKIVSVYEDGKITETYTYADGTKKYTKTISFGDGKVTTSIVYEGESNG